MTTSNPSTVFSDHDHENLYALYEKCKRKSYYKNGKPKLPVRRHYKIRERVHSQAEEQAKYLQFSEELAANSDMLDPVWIPKERSRDGDKFGFYYVVKGYTLLEY